MDTKKTYFKSRLIRTKREGMDRLINWLESTDFFFSPASSFYHRAYKGGLLDHSLYVEYILLKRLEEFEIGAISKESAIIIALLHDVCKTDLYNIDNGKYKCNYETLQKGHGQRSVGLISRHIRLTDIEKYAILYHMGLYGAHESGCKGTEYTLKEYVKAVNMFPIVGLLHECDNQEAKWKR